MWIFTYVEIHIYIYMYMYTHTHIHGVDTLDKRMAQMLDRIESDNLGFHCTLQSGMLFASGIFHLIFLDGHLTQAVEPWKGQMKKRDD